MIRVLLADDEIETRDNIVQCIDWSRNGLDLVGSASDGEMAFQMIQTLHPDIAILDIYMPRLNGIQVIERCHAQMKDPPAFIIISGYDDFSCAQQAIRLKVEEYLLKPFRPEDLMGAIQRALLQIELKRNGKKSDFITFVLACQKEPISTQRDIIPWMRSVIFLRQFLQELRRMWYDVWITFFAYAYWICRCQ